MFMLYQVKKKKKWKRRGGRINCFLYFRRPRARKNTQNNSRRRACAQSYTSVFLVVVTVSLE